MVPFLVTLTHVGDGRLEVNQTNVASICLEVSQL